MTYVSPIGAGEADRFLMSEAIYPPPRASDKRRNKAESLLRNYAAQVAMQRAAKLSKAQQLAAAEAWLANKEPLPAARVPDFEAPRRRR